MNVKPIKHEQNPTEHVMTIKLNTDTGELIGVYDNDGKKVEGHPLTQQSVLKNVPINNSNVSTLIYSHGSRGCYCYIRDGRLICVPPG
jgi:hypothetical protein